jgi:hypothetical protein
MKAGYFALVTSIIYGWVGASMAFAGAAPGAALLKAKQDAEKQGYIFISNRDEIVEQAKKEGKLRVLSAEDPAVIKATTEAFKMKYHS